MNDGEYSFDPAGAIAAAIDEAEEVVDPGQVLQKPRLLVDKANPDQTVANLRDILAHAGGLYDRGLPVRLAFDQV